MIDPDLIPAAMVAGYEGNLLVTESFVREILAAAIEALINNDEAMDEARDGFNDARDNGADITESIRAALRAAVQEER